MIAIIKIEPHQKELFDRLIRENPLVVFLISDDQWSEIKTVIKQSKIKNQEINEQA